MYNRIEQAVEKYGEVMIRTESGHEAELHQHNSEFIEEDKIIKIDADDKVHWLDAESIERYWIHYDF
ncbi:MAG: hypothetical protein ABEI78_01355 [Candidatus Nanohaloarchaea archaeon]